MPNPGRRSVRLHHPWTVAAIIYVAMVVLIDGLVGHGYTSLGILAVAPVLLALEWAWWVVLIASAPILAFATLAPFDPAPEGITELFRALGVLAGAAVAVGLSWSRVKRSAALAQSRAVAESTQVAILPPVPRAIGPYTFSVAYRSAADEARIGGDFYAAMPTPFGVRLIVGDVQGKGLDAVRMSARVLGSFREWAQRSTLGDLVAILDDSVTNSADEDEFVTAIVANLDDELHLDLANCGHPAPMLLRDGVRSLFLPTRRTTPLGLFADPAVDRQQLRAGERVFFYTDGLLEAHDRHRLGPELEDVLGLLTSPFDTSLADVLDRLEALPRPVTDDVALLLVECAEPSLDNPATVEPAARLSVPWWKKPPARRAVTGQASTPVMGRTRA